METTLTGISGNETRSSRKRKTILEAATRVFLEKGYDGASMDDVSTTAAVSKPTVYKYFQDKTQLYAQVVQATIEQIDADVDMVARAMEASPDKEQALINLATNYLRTLTNPNLLRLRRMIIANADRFPEVARSWYENGFGRVLARLAAAFADLDRRGILRVEDALQAANHFAGLVLWIPSNRAMFGAGYAPMPDEEVARHARMAVRAFLDGYRADETPSNR